MAVMKPLAFSALALLLSAQVAQACMSQAATIIVPTLGKFTIPSNAPAGDKFEVGGQTVILMQREASGQGYVFEVHQLDGPHRYRAINNRPVTKGLCGYAATAVEISSKD
jgi:hypothetical protein